MFATIIKKFRKDNELSQNEFIALVSKHHSGFKNLDVVTLSRWERQVTTPHLSRQNELLSLIGVNLLDVRQNDDISEELSTVDKKISNGDYAINANPDNINVVRITYINSHFLRRYTNLLNLILSYEDNEFFNLYREQKLKSQAIFEKIINEKLGELTLVLYHGQLLGHTLSINLMAMNNDIPWLSSLGNGQHHLIISMKSVNMMSILPTIGRELYQFFQNNAQGGYFCIYAKDKSTFDALYSLNFKYTLLDKESSKSGYLMKIDHKMIIDNKSLMAILSQYHQGISNV